ncbi:MAG: zf-TFIIB domain-containing protein [Chloracidobacterium sp.]|nr:zf-TFIIB domain-containing protein [Chloracidobacterium sp.]MCC6824661.1 zf-TFIIB domain-containing protein [Acidobacteriota bacterium]MCO5332795.1 zf-TFIIB domain-containing protein [Pyrinomonadaceae bacterium]
MSVDLTIRGDAAQMQCGDAHSPAAATASGTATATFKCPKCGGSLVETDFQNVKIDVCDGCSGVWFDAGEFIHVTSDEVDPDWFGRLFR